MLPAAHLDQNRRWAEVAAAAASATPTATSQPPHCSPYTLPSLGVIRLDPSNVITLAFDAVFTPECTAGFEDGEIDLGGPADASALKVSFNASVTPQIYATGAATVIAWFLFIMLVITPRTFFVGGVGGRSGLLGRRGMISGASGSSSVVGVGSRPWLQKIAALTVAISLTIATADTFRVAEEQYDQGFTDASALRHEVVGGMEIKISRVVSDIFLWLAQVQTLIRLFSRHKEKVIIKWTGFGLIVLDMTFSILNNFLIGHNGQPTHFVDAIPALNYLFQCALSMLYAAWVIYYALTKRRYAFYHKLMPNIFVVAVLSIISILTPLVFFITDISNYSVAGWGDYFRWVGAAAASVVVWEWVERIEALEREEKKDGILGREVFDGDDMLENTPHQEVTWPSHRRDRGDRRSGGDGAFGTGSHDYGLTNRLGRRSQHMDRTIMVPLGRVHSRSTSAREGTTAPSPPTATGYTPPHPVASPVSRTDTTSATSTVYTIRYHGLNEPMTPLPRQPSVPQESQRPPVPPTRQEAYFDKDIITNAPSDEINSNAQDNRWRWPVIATTFNPFTKRKAEPPKEILSGQIVDASEVEKIKHSSGSKTPQPPQFSRWDFKGRLGAFAAEQSERLRDRSHGNGSDTNLPVTIIPAQPRGRTWSPQNLVTQEADESQNATTPSPPQGTSNESDQSSNGTRQQRSISFADSHRGSLSQQPRPNEEVNTRNGNIGSSFSPTLSPVASTSPTVTNFNPSTTTMAPPSDGESPSWSSPTAISPRSRRSREDSSDDQVADQR